MIRFSAILVATLSVVAGVHITGALQPQPPAAPDADTSAHEASSSWLSGGAGASAMEALQSAACDAHKAVDPFVTSVLSPFLASFNQLKVQWNCDHRQRIRVMMTTLRLMDLVPEYWLEKVEKAYADGYPDSVLEAKPFKGYCKMIVSLLELSRKEGGPEEDVFCQKVKDYMETAINPKHKYISACCNLWSFQPMPLKKSR